MDSVDRHGESVADNRLPSAPEPAPWRRQKAGAHGCLLVIMLMGPARVYVGAHWPSDVLGGYLWGSLLLLLVLGLRADTDRVLQKHRR
jgi:membrane-associated phospholipid phosphatase